MDLDLEKLTAFFGAGDDQGKLVRSLILLILVGIMFLAFSGLFTSDEHHEMPSAPPEEDEVGHVPGGDYGRVLEHKLEEILSSFEGAGEVMVRITLERGAEKKYLKNQMEDEETTVEDDGQGGTRETHSLRTEEELATVQRDSSREEPVLIGKSKPRVRGVLVAAQGARDSRIKSRIARAVETFLDLPQYRIRVLPKADVVDGGGVDR